MNREQAVGPKRSGWRTWTFVVLAVAGVGVLLAAGIAAVTLVLWSARPGGPPKTFARPAFTFEYPSTWTVDDKDADYDPDHLFTIDASIGAMILFVIADAELDPSGTLAAHVRAQTKRMPNAARAEFDHWGKYHGQGVVLRGNAIGLVRATIRVFVFNAGGKTFSVIEYCPDDELQQLSPGFQTIEKSFRVLSAGEG